MNTDASEQAVTGRSDRPNGAPVPPSMRALLAPAAVAVIGASRDRASLGRRVLDGLATHGYTGEVYPVNAHADDIGGRRCYHAVAELPRGIDLGIVAVPRDQVLPVVDDCIANGVRALVVITAGFAETGPEGRALQDQIAARVRRAGVRLVGPNCMGLINTRFGTERVVLAGVSAGGPCRLLLAERRAWADHPGTGGRSRHRAVDVRQRRQQGRRLEQRPARVLGSRSGHDVILLYLESFGNPRKFGDLARRIGRRKPIVAVKAGRTREGERAASSHTAALAATDAVVDALFESTGVIRAGHDRRDVRRRGLPRRAAAAAGPAPGHRHQRGRSGHSRGGRLRALEPIGRRADRRDSRSG